MFKQDALEAEPIIVATLKSLLEWSPTSVSDRDGANLKAAVNNVRVNVTRLLHTNTIGESLANCFDLAYTTGMTLPQIERVRKTPLAVKPKLVGAIVIRDTLIHLCLVTASRIIADTEFISREDVDTCKAIVNVSFTEAEEDATNQMDAMIYRDIVSLHAAVSFYLTETARPLPRMLRYQFNVPLPTLVIAHRLYQDAGRADDILKENKIVHPAFSPLVGAALSN
jgi:prophage DNA circulation protein